MNTILPLTSETMNRFIPTPPKTRKHPWYKVERKEAWLSYLKPGEKLPSVPKGVKKRGLVFEIVRGIDEMTGRDCARITRMK